MPKAPDLSVSCRPVTYQPRRRDRCPPVLFSGHGPIRSPRLPDHAGGPFGLEPRWPGCPGWGQAGYLPGGKLLWLVQLRTFHQARIIHSFCPGFRRIGESYHHYVSKPTAVVAFGPGGWHMVPKPSQPPTFNQSESHAADAGSVEAWINTGAPSL